MADVPFEFGDLPVLSAFRPNDQLIVVDPTKVAAQQPARVSKSLVGGAGAPAAWYEGTVSLSSRQALSSSFSDIGTGLDVTVPAAAGCVVVFVTVWAEKSAGEGQVTIQLRRGTTSVIESRETNLSENNIPISISFMFVDTPGNSSITYSVRAREDGGTTFVSNDYESAIVAVRIG